MFDHTSVVNTCLSIGWTFLLGFIAHRFVEGVWKRSLVWELGVGLTLTGASYAITAITPYSNGSLAVLATSGVANCAGVLIARRILPASAPRKL